MEGKVDSSLRYGEESVGGAFDNAVSTSFRELGSQFWELGGILGFVIRENRSSVASKGPFVSKDEKGKLENNVSVALEIPSESVSKGSSVVLISD